MNRTRNSLQMSEALIFTGGNGGNGGNRKARGLGFQESLFPPLAPVQKASSWAPTRAKNGVAALHEPRALFVLVLRPSSFVLEPAQNPRTRTRRRTRTKPEFMVTVRVRKHVGPSHEPSTL